MFSCEQGIDGGLKPFLSMPKVMRQDWPQHDQQVTLGDFSPTFILQIHPGGLRTIKIRPAGIKHIF